MAISFLDEGNNFFRGIIKKLISSQLMKNHTVPTLNDLPPAPPDKSGWPWTENPQPLPESIIDGSAWPRISIVTPNYNYGHYLEETIRSVLLQGYPHLEYIVIDGGSTDNSVEIIKKYEPWLTYWVSEKDEGQATAINKGFRQASGDILAWLNSDDLLLPNCLEIVAKEMLKRPDVGLLYGDRIVVDAATNVTGMQFAPSLITPYHWIIGAVLPQECCFWRHESSLAVGELNQEFITIFDHEFLMRIWQQHPSMKISHFLGMYRSTEETITSRLVNLRNQEVEKLFANKSVQFKSFSNKVIKPLIQLQYRFEQIAALFKKRVSVKRTKGQWIWSVNQ